VKLIVHLFLREFLGRVMAGAYNRHRIIFKSQFERPGAVFVFGVLHVARDGPVGNMHDVDVINVGSFRSAKGVSMKIVLRVVGILLVAFGCIWFLQGVNVLPGSFMTGQIRWAVYGAIAVVVGIGLLFAAKRRTLRG
jgi:hypothetical protein